MVSVEFKQEKHNALVSFDDCHSGVVSTLYGQFAGAFHQGVLGELFP